MPTADELLAARLSDKNLLRTYESAMTARYSIAQGVKEATRALEDVLTSQRENERAIAAYEAELENRKESVHAHD